MEKFKNTSKITKLRIDLQEKTSHQLNQWIEEQMTMNDNNWVVFGQHVCVRAWTKLLGISSYKVYQVRNNQQSN